MVRFALVIFGQIAGVINNSNWEPFKFVDVFSALFISKILSLIYMISHSHVAKKSCDCL